MPQFPWREYTHIELTKEYNKLRKKLHELEPIFPAKHSLTGMKCSNDFFQYERLSTPSQGKKSCYEMWNKDNILIKSRYEKYVKKHGEKGLYSYITLYYTAPAQFPPFVAGAVYKYFKAKSVLDPFSGWGDRCIAAMALDINYIGIDSNSNLKIHYENMIKYYPTKSTIKIFNDKCENIDIDSLEFDIILSSPPYWKNGKLLEKYNECGINYEDFLEHCLYPMMVRCLSRDVWICLHLPLEMYDNLKIVFGQCKLNLQFGNRSNRVTKGNNIIYCWKGEKLQ